MRKNRITLETLARRIGADLMGPSDLEIDGICSIDEVTPGCVTFAERRGDLSRLSGQPAPAAIICGKDVPSGEIPLLRTDNPKLAFAMALSLFFPEELPEPGIHPSAVVASDARVGRGVSIGAHCCIGRDVTLGDGTVLYPCVVVGDGVTIGDACIIYPNVSIYARSRIGARVILHSGVVVGADGFGYVRGDDGRQTKVPQTGNVVIEDDVEIGANSAVDRATLGSTVIGAGSKIDNLVQIGHNVRIGRNVVLCGEVGLSGSSAVGDNSILAGQVGVADHVRIGKNCILGGRSGVVKDIPDNSFYSGFPARPHRENMKMMSLLKRLPEMAEILKKIQDINDK